MHPPRRPGAHPDRHYHPRHFRKRSRCPGPVVVHAEATQRAQVALLSACGLSVGYQHGGWNAIIAFWSRPPDLCSSGSGRPTPPCAPRRGTRSPDIDSVLVRGVFVRFRVRSCIVRMGIQEGWYPANTDGHLSRTRELGCCMCNWLGLRAEPWACSASHRALERRVGIFERLWQFP